MLQDNKTNKIRYGVEMKKVIPIIFCLLLTLCVVIGVLLYQFISLRKTASNETTLRQQTEWTAFCGVKNVGQTVSLDSITAGRHFLLRYDSSTCLTCIVDAEELLDEVFGKDYLAKELCCIGDYGQVRPSKDILFVQSRERITPMDDVYTPYFCVINDNGDVLFTLSLVPDMCDYNRNLLLKLKKTLSES